MKRFKLYENNGGPKAIELEDWYPTLEAAKESAMIVIVRDPYVESVSIYRDNLYCGEMYQTVSANPANNGSRWQPSMFVKEAVEFDD